MPTPAAHINRHYYTSEEIAEAVQRPVVDALFRLIRFRNNHPAFDGKFSLSGGGTQLVATWTHGEEIAELSADLASGAATVQWTAAGHDAAGSTQCLALTANDEALWHSGRHECDGHRQSDRLALRSQG